MEQFPAKNPNPLLNVAKGGTILYSNDAGKFLLSEWGVKVGEKLPASIGDFVQRVLSRNSLEKMEVKAGKRTYMVTFYPSPEESCVNIYGFDISDQKELEEKAQESEGRKVANVELAEIIDIKIIKPFFNDFHKLTHIPIGLRDLKNNILAGAGWQDICTKFHRVHPETCQKCIESGIEQSRGILPGEYKLYKCKNNMWDILTPVTVSNQHVGNIIAGQFLFDDEPLDYELFRSQARKYSFNEDEYIAALEKVPRLSREAVDKCMSISMAFANMISQLSYSNIKLAQSLSERDTLLEILCKSEEKYRNIVETANEGIALINSEGIITYANKKMADMLGFAAEEIVGSTIWDFVEGKEKSAVTKIFEKRHHGSDASFEIKFLRKDGSPLWVFVNTKPLFDKNGKFMGALNLHTDITQRKKAEEALNQIEIARKKEIHHRIKNNLQVISSLLDMQADRIKYKENITKSEVLEAFKESQNRVISMALIHEELHKGGENNTLNFSQYIKKLADNLFLTYKLRNYIISLDTDIEENILFDTDTSVPLGIIINELVSNSFKHAFSGRDKGEIRIQLHREGCKSKTFILSITDNGIGIPEYLDIEDLDSLGLQLVTILVDQLDGELELKRNNGTEFTIKFTVKDNDFMRQHSLRVIE